MSMINYASREINCKLVYYGPGLGGGPAEGVEDELRCLVGHGPLLGLWVDSFPPALSPLTPLPCKSRKKSFPRPRPVR